MHSRTVEEQHNVRVLLDASRVAKVAQLWFAVLTALRLAGELGEGEDRDVELFGDRLEPARDLRHLLDARVLATAAHQLEVVDNHQVDLLLGPHPPGPGAQLADRERRGVVDPDVGLREPVHGARDSLEGVRVRLAGADQVGVDLGLAADEPLHQRLLAHLQGEDHHPPLGEHRRVAGDVEGERRLSDRRPGRQDDQLAGLEALRHRIQPAVVGGHAVDDLPALGSALHQLPGLGEHLGDVADLQAPPGVGDGEDPPLRGVEDVVGPLTGVEAELGHLPGRGDETAAHRVVHDDLGVVRHRGGGGHLLAQLGQVLDPPTPCQAAIPLQLHLEGEDVDWLTAIGERQRGPEDVAVALRVEVAGVQEVAHRQDGVGVDQQAAEHRLLGIEVMGQDAPRRRGRPERRRPPQLLRRCAHFAATTIRRVSVTSGWSSISTSWGPRDLIGGSTAILRLSISRPASRLSC